MLTKEKKKGFSLLELLVVISIIGILIASGTAAYSTAQKRARDSRREADLKAIQNALEQYHSVNGGLYPGGTYPNGISALMSGSLIPADPKTENNYCAASYTTALYRICTDLEGVGSWSPSSCTNNDFCISNLQ